MDVSVFEAFFAQHKIKDNKKYRTAKDMAKFHTAIVACVKQADQIPPQDYFEKIPGILLKQERNCRQKKGQIG